MLMEAYEIRKADRYDEIAAQAWWNQQVKATKGKGKSTKPYYKHLSDMYDSAARIDQIRAAFEDNYQPKSKAMAQRDASQIIADRMLEFQEKYAKKNKKGGTP